MTCAAPKLDLINIPPPLPLGPISKTLKLFASTPHNIEDSFFRINQSQKAHVPVSISNITRILMQFGECKTYGVTSGIVMNGFSRNVQKQLTRTIPSEIVELCSSFYFEEANNCIHLAYDLYKLVRNNATSETSEHFEGKMAISLINDSDLDAKYGLDIAQIFTELVKYQFIEVTSYRTSFCAIMSDCISADDPNCSTYVFVKQVSEAFGQFLDSQSSN